MKKVLFIIAILLHNVFNGYSQENNVLEKIKTDLLNELKPTTYTYIERENDLQLDIYKPEGIEGLNKSIIYIFGGAFIQGDKRDTENLKFYKELIKGGFTVIAINYRLGMKGVKKVGLSNPKPPFIATRIASEDLIAATKFILDNKDELGIDPEKISLIGSSAGAITALRTSYEVTNKSEMAASLPANFQYASVVSLAGALFTDNGKPKYNNKPSPTLFIHGTKDKIVPYRGIQAFGFNITGTHRLTKLFNKKDFNYTTIRYINSTHEVAEFPRYYCPEVILKFINESIKGNNNNKQVDITIEDSYVIENLKQDYTFDFEM